MLVDTNWQGQPRKLLLQANRNGFFYVLDRTNGQLLLGKQFLKNLNWAKGHRREGPSDSERSEGKRQRRNLRVSRASRAAPTGSRRRSIPARASITFRRWSAAICFTKRDMEWQAGKGFMGGAARPAPGETFTKSLRAINIQTGEIAWDLPQVSGPVTASAGVISTASGLVFFGENSGSFMAADAANGKVLWEFPDESGLEGVADDLHVRQQAVHRDRRRAEHRRLRASGLNDDSYVVSGFSRTRCVAPKTRGHKALPRKARTQTEGHCFY